jgi:hypothetical protein
VCLFAFDCLAFRPFWWFWRETGHIQKLKTIPCYCHVATGVHALHFSSCLIAPNWPVILSRLPWRRLGVARPTSRSRILNSQCNLQWHRLNTCVRCRESSLGRFRALSEVHTAVSMHCHVAVQAPISGCVSALFASVRRLVCVWNTDIGTFGGGSTFFRSHDRRQPGAAAVGGCWTGMSLKEVLRVSLRWVAFLLDMGQPAEFTSRISISDPMAGMASSQHSSIASSGAVLKVRKCEAHIVLNSLADSVDVSPVPQFGEDSSLRSPRRASFINERLSRFNSAAARLVWTGARHPIFVLGMLPFKPTSLCPRTDFRWIQSSFTARLAYAARP